MLPTTRSTVLAHHLLSLALLLLACMPLLLARVVHAERPNTPMSVLVRAPFQLDVTVLSIELKDGPHSGSSVWHRVRIDRVIVASGLDGERLKVGDETAVVSVIRVNPSGSTGSSGDRSEFSGPNGLPIKGDRARLYADGSAKILKPLPPNGWHPVGTSIAFIAADEQSDAERTIPFLASLVSSAGIGRTSVHLATTGNGTGSPSTTPKADEKSYFTEQYQLRYSGETIVLQVRDLKPDYNTSLDLADAVGSGRCLVAFRSSVDATGFPSARRKSKDPPAPRVKLFGTTVTTRRDIGSATRVLPPAEASRLHPMLAGIDFPANGLVLSSPLIELDTLAEDCLVLLWGEPIDRDGKSIGAKQPVLWTREVPRTTTEYGIPIKHALPAQRIAVTTLGALDDYANPEFRVLAMQVVAWAADQLPTIHDATRAKIRATSPPVK